MTACVNRKHSKKVAAVVTASLVGALSLGVAPVAAMAEEAGIDLQLAPGGIEEGTEFAEGDVNLTFVEPFTGNVVTAGTDADGVTTVTADEIPFIVGASSVQLAGNQEPIYTGAGSDFRFGLYRADENGDPTGSALPGFRVTEGGSYVFTVTPLDGSEYTGQTFKKLFKVVPADIAATTAFEHGDIADNVFQYTGGELDIAFANGTDVLEEGVDYTVRYTKILNADGTTAADGKKTDKIVDAGTYDAVLTGIGNYKGTTVVEDIEVLPFDLNAVLEADANDGAIDEFVVIKPFTQNLPEHPERVFWDTTGTDQDVDLDPSLVNLKFADNTTAGSMPAGAYDVILTVDQAAINSGNVKYNGTYSNDTPAKMTVAKCDVEAQFLYNGQALGDTLDVFVGQAFNENAIAAAYNGTIFGYYGTNTDVVVEGTVNSNVPGEYKITVGYNLDAATGWDHDNNAATDNLIVAGAKTVTVRVWAGAIDADTGLWAYGPDSSTVAIQSYAKAYDGLPLRASHFLVGNKDGSVNSVGNGLTLKLYNAEGEEIDYALDAGEYYLEVTSDDYKLTGDVRLPITIEKVDLTTAEIGKLQKWNDVAGMDYLPLDSMTWVAGDQPYWLNTNWLTVWSLGLVYDTGNDGAAFGENGYAAFDFKGQDLLPDGIEVIVEKNDDGEWKGVARIDEEGDYRVTLSVDEASAANYVLPEGETSITLEFTTSPDGSFSDVQPDMWYFGAVEQAKENGYVNGDAGTSTFRPEASITRGEVAVILYNMSGVAAASDNENESGSWNETLGWVTGFDDVDGHKFYAEAIAWAKRAGVINGDAGTKNFRPDDTVTNEEFAAMLANYAAKVNRDSSVAEADVDSLAEAVGGEGVSEWAQKSVAWAVENEIMGNNGADIAAQGDITRARVAAMCVNYQPEAKTRPEA